MNVKSLAKKSALVAAGAAPLVGALNIQPASATQVSLFDGAYPNCNSFYAQHNNDIGSALTAGCNNYNGTVLVRVKYKLDGHVLIPPSNESHFYAGGLASVSIQVPPGADLLESCHRASEDGRGKGPMVWVDRNGWHWTGSEWCTF
jgi:hypothetical protein